GPPPAARRARPGSTAPPAYPTSWLPGSLADVAVAGDHVLVGRQFAQAARPAGVELVGADADLRAEAEFEAVVEPRAGVDHHRRRIDLPDEPLRRGQVPGDDRVRVARAVTVDVFDRGRQIRHDLYRQNPVEIFSLEILLRGWIAVGNQFAGPPAAAQFHTLLNQGSGDDREELPRDPGVDQQALRRVAHAGPLALGVDDDAPGHFQI